MEESLKYVSICGLLGYGYPVESLNLALKTKPSFIGVDAGSTDPGPYYLGNGTSFVKALQIKRDLEPVLIAARKNNIPLIIGTAGGSGARPHVDFFVDILLELAHKNNLKFKLATIYADIDKVLVSEALRAGKISPCGPVHDLTEDIVNSSINLVGQMGTEPIVNALEAEADVIVAGRCCDTAIFASLPIMKGYDPGLALHSAKIAECGALCARPVGANDCLIVELKKDSFTVTPANKIRKCTPDSVAAHSLYEQPNPSYFIEPEGTIDMASSKFESIDQRSVRVSGTKLISEAKRTIKLEAAQFKGYRSISIAGICDPIAIQNLDVMLEQVELNVSNNLKGILDSSQYQLFFRSYGKDAVCRHQDRLEPPSEIGLVIEAIAPTQELADTILSLARSTALHQSFPNRKATAGNLAFPFSPSDFKGGQVYEFSVYHLMEIESESALFPVKFKEV